MTFTLATLPYSCAWAVSLATVPLVFITEKFLQRQCQVHSVVFLNFCNEMLPTSYIPQKCWLIDGSFNFATSWIDAGIFTMLLVRVVATCLFSIDETAP